MKNFLTFFIVIMAFSGFLAMQIAWDMFGQSDSENSSSKETSAQTVQDDLVEQNKDVLEKLFKTAEFSTINGKKYRLSKVSAPIVVLNFWASWCLPCLAEMSSLVKLRDSFSENEMLILGINSDDIDYMMKIKKMEKEYDMNFEIVSDPKGDFLKSFNIMGLPYTIVFVKGKVYKIMNGATKFNDPNLVRSFKDIINK